MLPSIFGENLFDDFFGDPFGMMPRGRDPLYGKHAKNLMRTDVRETEDTYELDVDLPGLLVPGDVELGILLLQKPQLAQGGVIQRPPPPGGENPPGTDHPDARDPQEGVIIRGVDLHGKVFQVGHGPTAFGVQLGV